MLKSGSWLNQRGVIAWLSSESYMFPVLGGDMTFFKSGQNLSLGFIVEICEAIDKFWILLADCGPVLDDSWSHTAPVTISIERMSDDVNLLAGDLTSVSNASCHVPGCPPRCRNEALLSGS